MPKKKLLSKDEILAMDDLATEKVFIPEWNGHVIVRALMASERDEIEAKVLSAGNRSDRLVEMRALTMMMSVVAEDGTRLFTKDDIKTLGKKSGSAIDRIFAVAQRLSKMRAEDLEELVGNSAGGPSEGSTSD